MQPTRIAIFDFDETLAVSTGWPGADPTSLFGGAARLSELSALLASLKDAGVLLSVCTFNRADCVTLLLRKAGLLQYFDQRAIIGEEIYDEGGAYREAVMRNRLAAAAPGSEQRPVLPSDMTRKMFVWNKGLSIRQLLLPLVAGHALEPGGSGGHVDARSVLFVDDDAGNCRDVSRAVPGCTVVHVSRAAGMRADEGGAVREFGAVREWLARPPAAALGGKGTVAQKEDGAVDEFALSGMV